MTDVYKVDGPQGFYLFDFTCAGTLTFSYKENDAAHVELRIWLDLSQMASVWAERHPGYQHGKTTIPATIAMTIRLVTGHEHRLQFPTDDLTDEIVGRFQNPAFRN